MNSLRCSVSIFYFRVLSLFLAVFSGSAFAQDQLMAGIWLPDNSRSQSVISPLPFTDQGRELVAAWQAGRDPVEDDPGRFCQSAGMPSIALSGAGYPMEIVVTSDHVLILLEAHQQVRRIFLDSDHPEKLFPQRNGHSTGHWDGDVLEIDTVGIRPILFGSVPHGENIHVQERISVLEDGAALLNVVTITDPDLYSKPIVVERVFTTAPEGTMMLEYECTEAMWIEHQEDRGLAPFSL